MKQLIQYAIYMVLGALWIIHADSDREAILAAFVFILSHIYMNTEINHGR